VVKQALLIVALVLALRLPFLHQAIQGDDVYYLYGAEHGQIDPWHPTHTRYVFLGDLLDMRGNSHPPLDAWILTGLLVWFGDVREVPFHLAYTLFSLIAALAMLSLARRFSGRPLLATMLFCAVPAFVVNGGSLESDLPFLAFWMAAVALFVHAVDLRNADRRSGWWLTASAASAGLAALAAYQAIFLTPILALYAWQQRRAWMPAWAVALAAPATLGVWQLWERSTSGALPASVLAGYLGSYHFAALARSVHGAAALVVHLAWIVSPLVLFFALRHTPRWTWILAVMAAAAAALYDQNPLSCISFGLGVWVLGWCASKARAREGFLGWWVLLFFAPAMAVFFAGSARYLLPIAAPVAILAADAVGPRVAAAGFALQMALSLALAVVNYQHWDGYRQFSAKLAQEAATRRVWVDGEWGLRYYLESEGALPLTKGQVVQPGDVVVSNALANPFPVGVPLAPLAEVEIRPTLPLRLIALDGRSAYSNGSRGLLPFEISTGPIDRIRAEIAVEPKLTYLDP
jgi:hypothetical protein